MVVRKEKVHIPTTQRTQRPPAWKRDFTMFLAAWKLIRPHDYQISVGAAAAEAHLGDFECRVGGLKITGFRGIPIVRSLHGFCPSSTPAVATTKDQKPDIYPSASSLKKWTELSGENPCCQFGRQLLRRGITPGELRSESDPSAQDTRLSRDSIVSYLSLMHDHCWLDTPGKLPIKEGRMR